MEIRSEVQEGAAVGTVARLVGASGAIITKADVTSWDLRVFDTSEPSALKRGVPIYELLAVDPATTNTNAVPGSPEILSDAYREDGYWDGGPPGYNLLHFLLPTVLSGYIPIARFEGGHVYRLEYEFATTWGPVLVVHTVSVVPSSK